MSNKPLLQNTSFTFTQEGNCNGSAGEYEELIVDFESSIGIDNDKGGYFVLRTQGWSVDGVEELEELFDRIRAIAVKSKKK